MRKIKRFAVSLLAAAISLSGASVLAANADGGSVGGNVPKVYETQFTVGGWIQFYDTGKTSYLDQVRELARCGMNLIDAPNAASGAKGSNSATRLVSEFVKNQDEFYAALDAVAQELNMYYFYQGSDMYDFDACYEKARQLAACIGYHLKDEPSSAQMDALAETVLEFGGGDPSRWPFVNLFPSYAGATNLGGTYRDYITKWVNLVGSENMDYLYFDHYPFTQTEDVRSTYFSDLEVIRDVAYKNGKIKTGGFTQMGSWNGMTRPTEDMARWSMNSLLAYGLKSISHFCWVAPSYVAPENGGEGMRDFVTDFEGNPTDLYEPMTVLNWQTRQLGNILMNIDVKHAYHTAKTPVGAEALPSGFILQPGKSTDSFVYSIAYTKDTNEPYLLVFNKDLSGEAKEYRFNVDLTTGIEKIKYYKPTDYTADTLPDPGDLENTLLAPEEIEYDVSGGSFNDTFKPGEIKIYKLLGDNLEIFEELNVPESSHQSGIYIGPQKISLTTGDNGAKIYYTTDGSFPEVNKGTTKLYDGTFEIGSYGESETYTVRAISVRGSDVSRVLDIDLMIMDASRNIAQGKIGKFLSMDMSRKLEFEGFNGSAANIKNLTDGSFDPGSSTLSTKEVGWAVIDLGEEASVDKVTFSMWHDWWFGKVKIQLACKEDFSDAVTVFEAESMQNVATVGKTVTFEPKRARYLRATNDCKGEGKQSLFTELQVYTAYDSGENLIADKENWSAVGGGNFTNDGTIIREADEYQTSKWDKAYSYNAKTYENFMIDAKMSIDVSDPGAWGYVGVQIFRDSTDVVQSNTGKGVVVGIEPKGRALLWNGSREIGPLDANIVGWNVGHSFDFKLIVYKGTVSLAIDNRPVMNVYSADFLGKNGYISIHSGLLPMTVTKFNVTLLGDDFAFPVKGQAAAACADTKVAVERYLSEKEVLKKLGDSVEVIDTAGVKHSVSVTWSSDEYDRMKTGNFAFIGLLDAAELENLGISNIYGIKAYATVFVKSEIDRSVIENLLNIVAGLKSYEYTEDSWAYLQLKVEAAESILADEFLVQSDVNVGMFQLYDALYKTLEFSGDLTALQSAIDEAKAVNPAFYTDYSYADYKALLDDAESYMTQSFKTYEEVKAKAAALKESKKYLVEKIAEGKEFMEEKPSVEPLDKEKPGCNSSLALGGITGILLFAIGIFLKKR